MATLTCSNVTQALKRHGFQCKNLVSDVDGGSFGVLALHFYDVRRGAQLSGKIVDSFTEGEVYHWPLLSHRNVAPLIDVVFVDDRHSIFLTIDRRVTLKSIVHETAFLHDPRCFVRKKMYAKGVFSGLAYLHERSLCLMNLSDSTVVICRTTDKAILADLSCLTCSRRTTQSRMSVPELYKAPEVKRTDAESFDTVAAEMWSAGVLMLDLFLSHMVPWAVVDHNPARAPTIVETLSHELLQAANAGSQVTLADHLKFKSFLRCFFKDKPICRVTSRHAMIATFLKVRPPETFPKVVRSSSSDWDDLSLSRMGFADIDRVSSAVESVPVRWNGTATECNKQELDGGSDDCEEEDGWDEPTTSQPAKKSSQREALNICQQTKSMSVFEPSHEKKTERLAGDRLRKISSCSNVKEVPRSFAACEKRMASELGLERLFEEPEGPEEEDAEFSLLDDIDEQSFRPMDETELKKSLTDLQKPVRTEQEAVKKVMLVNRCLRSLQQLPVFSISPEFEQRQQEILREYKILLMREKMRLYEARKGGWRKHAPSAARCVEPTSVRRGLGVQPDELVVDIPGWSDDEDIPVAMQIPKIRPFQMDKNPREPAGHAPDASPKARPLQMAVRQSLGAAVADEAEPPPRNELCQSPDETAFLYHVDSTATLLRQKYQSRMMKMGRTRPKRPVERPKKTERTEMDKGKEVEPEKPKRQLKRSFLRSLCPFGGVRRIPSE